LTVTVVLIILGIILSVIACSRKKSTNDDAFAAEYENEIKKKN